MTMNQSIRTQISKWIIDKYAGDPDPSGKVDLYRLFANKYCYILLKKYFIRINDNHAWLERTDTKKVTILEFSDPDFFTKFDDLMVE